MRHAIVPFHTGTQLPRHVHATIRAHHHTAVLDGRNFRGEHRHDVHLLIARHQPFNDAALDIFEDVCRIAVHRIRLPVVADSEQIVGRAFRAAAFRITALVAGSRHHCRDHNNNGCKRAESIAHHATSAIIMRATNGTGIEP